MRVAGWLKNVNFDPFFSYKSLMWDRARDHSDKFPSAADTAYWVANLLRPSRKDKNNLASANLNPPLTASNRGLLNTAHA